MKDTERIMVYQARSRRKRPKESKKKTTVINLANLDFPSCKGLARKDC